MFKIITRVLLNKKKETIYYFTVTNTKCYKHKYKQNKAVMSYLLYYGNNGCWVGCGGDVDGGRVGHENAVLLMLKVHKHVLHISF